MIVKRLYSKAASSASFNASSLLKKHNTPSADHEKVVDDSRQQERLEALKSELFTKQHEVASIEREYKEVTIPTQPSAKEAHVNDYNQYSQPLLKTLSQMKLKEKEHAFMERLVDSVSKNPTMNMRDKIKAFKIAANFFEGKPFNSTVSVLKGRRQEFRPSLLTRKERQQQQ